MRLLTRSGDQLHWLAVRSATIGICPGLFAREQRGRIGQALGRDKALESRQPMLVVMRAVVGLAAIGSGLEFAGERCGPLLPREMPLLGELDGQRKRLRLPRLGKHRPAFVARQRR
jgi:hypothetical protein